MRPWVLAAGLAAALVGVIGEFRSPVNGDVAYMLDAAGRMLGGERLYADLIDLNPPFMFWLSEPAAALADGAGAVAAFRMMVLALAAAMLVLAWPVSRGQPGLRAGYVLIAFMLPLGHFGEREHVIFCLVFPYVALAVHRACGLRVSTGLAVGIGVAAGAGMALKPPAALLALALAAISWRRMERDGRRLHPEHLAVTGVLAAGFMLVLVFAPAYLRAIAEYGALYAEFSRGTLLGTMFGHLYGIFTFAALVLAGLTAVSVGRRSTAAVLAAAAMALYGAAIVQAKGFSYHYLPAYGFAVMLAIELMTAGGNARVALTALRRIAAAVLLLAMLAPPLAVAMDRARGAAVDPLPGREALANVLKADAPGNTFAMLSVRLGDAYPLVLYHRFEYVLSVPSLWFADLEDGDGAASSLWRRVAREIGARAPAVIVARAPDPAQAGPGDLDFDYVARLCATPGGPEALRDYGLATRVAGYAVYRRDFSGAQPCASS